MMYVLEKSPPQLCISSLVDLQPKGSGTPPIARPVAKPRASSEREKERERARARGMGTAVEGCPHADERVLGPASKGRSIVCSQVRVVTRRSWASLPCLSVSSGCHHNKR